MASQWLAPDRPPDYWPPQSHPDALPDEVEDARAQKWAQVRSLISKTRFRTLPPSEVQRENWIVAATAPGQIWSSPSGIPARGRFRWHVSSSVRPLRARLRVDWT